LHSIAIVPGKPNDVYFGAHYFLYHSNDGGRTWTKMASQMMLSLALNPKNPSTMWAVSLQKGLITSTDGGKHWTAMASAIGKGDVTAVMKSPSTPTLYAYGAGIYRSPDGGGHWTHLEKATTVFDMASGAATTVYAATGDALLISRDDGAHWAVSKAIGNQPVAQVAGSGSTAYAITAAGLMRTTNDGHSWSLLANAPQGVQLIGLSSGAPSTLVAEIAQKGFYVSTDAGATWRKTSGIAGGNFTGSTVQLAATDPKIGYTGSWGLHVYATHDGGFHWTQTTTLKS
jgi:photosystem II stability/assembly factor-like uncharacterized protein